MHAFYINLDWEPERRQFIERNFADHISLDWPLHRVPAVGTQFVREHGIGGNLREVEKACYLSHIRAINQSLSYEGHAFILEDDVLFGPTSQIRIKQALRTLDEYSWDIIFTNICATNLYFMIDLFNMRRMMQPKSEFRLLNLFQRDFGGAVSYIVNVHAKEKILSLLSNTSNLEAPYDLHLRKFIKEQLISSFVIYPFPTSLSLFGDDSKIQPLDTKITDAALHAFRRLVWADAEWCQDDIMGTINQIDPAYYDSFSEKFGKILSVVLSPNFKHK